MAELTEVLDETVRRERGRIVGGLLRLCGSLDAAEDAFHDAVVAALRAWRSELPANPGAWLTAVARNGARDALRRRAVAAAQPATGHGDEVDAPETIDTVSDDHLRLLFTCCDPALSTDNQIALTLKVVAGFSTEEIARAFLCSEETISQRILRARRTLEQRAAPHGAAAPGDRGARVAAVLGVLHAMFNEAHTARAGPLLRLDLHAEALRLGRLVCDLLPAEAEAFGLVAMMAFGAARAHTRVDPEGAPILLAEQDRSRWSGELLREGLMALQRARSLRGRGPFVLQAELAAVHVTARTWEETDWAAMVALYDALAREAPSPVVSLNRAVAVSMRDGPAAGLAALDGLEQPLSGYHLFYATRAELKERAGEDGRADLSRALALAKNDGERRLLARRLATSRAARGS